MTHITLLAKPCDGWSQKGDGPVNIWTDTVRKGFEYIDGQAIYGLRTKKEWLPSAMALDRIAWRLGDLTLVAREASL